ncbi:MAG: hypothetical protein NWF05_08350 [Candidatus Bathyarchaeota archaeon]|nr:hypothetical protein [Candidatus Bathyarchaeota archaeon]
MNTFRKIRKNTKALSPVVASIILIAVTVAVSVAVAAWMGGMVVGQMETEELKITNCQFMESPAAVNLTVSNTGTTSVVIDQALVDNADQTFTIYAEDGVTTADSIPKNAKGYTVEIDFTAVSGNSYTMKLVSSKGNYYLYNAIMP